MGLLSSIGKALFGGKKKKGQVTLVQDTDVDPYAPTIPYLNDYLAQTKALYGGGAPQISDMEQRGLDMLESTVNAGATAVNPAIVENNKTLSGAYLNPETNPYLRGIAERIAGIAGSNVNATFGGRGRSGGGLAGYYAGKGIADATGDLYGQAYEAERGRMGQAVGLAPQLEAGRYLGPQALISAGQNVSARPYDINQQYGGILAQIGSLGRQGTNNSTETQYKQSSGLIGKIANSFVNKLFG